MRASFQNVRVTTRLRHPVQRGQLPDAGQTTFGRSSGRSATERQRSAELFYPRDRRRYRNRGRLLFDDECWNIRYLVVDTGRWLSSRKVLVSPLAVGTPDRMNGVLPVSLTKAQVEGSPGLDARKPLSRQHEAEYREDHGYPYYWDGTGGLATSANPGSVRYQRKSEADLKARQSRSSSTSDVCHLRSSNALISHYIEATDGDIGHVADLLVDADLWAIRYMVVNTSNWWVSHVVLVAPQWVKEVKWRECKVSVDLTRQAVKDAPPYDPAKELDRQLEQEIYRHYGRQGYWTTESRQSR